MRLRSSISPARSAARSLRLTGFLRLITFARHMTRLTTVEAVTAPTTTATRLSGLLGLVTVAGHVAWLTAVEAVTATASAATTRLSWLFGLLALAGHVARFAAVEAVFATTAGSAAVAASATLLAPADSNPLALKLMTIKVSNSLLSVLLLVEVHETECTLIND